MLYVILTICGRGQRVRPWEYFIGKRAKVHELAYERLKGLDVFAYVGKKIVATNRIKFKMLRVTMRLDPDN